MKIHGILIIALLGFGNLLGGNVVYQELATSNDIFKVQHLTQEAHPQTYAMVQSIAEKADFSVPYSVVVFQAWSSFAQGRNGRRIYFDDQYRLCFCRATLAELSDEGIEGAIALAFAAKRVNKYHDAKSFIAFWGTFAATLCAAPRVPALLNRFSPVLGVIYHDVFEGSLSQNSFKDYLLYYGLMSIPAH